MRVKILQVWPNSLLSIFKNGTDKIKIINNALPEDAKFVRAFYDDYKYANYICIVIESKSFDDIKDGELIPITPSPIFEKVYEKVEV